MKKLSHLSILAFLIVLFEGCFIPKFSYETKYYTDAGDWFYRGPGNGSDGHPKSYYEQKFNVKIIKTVVIQEISWGTGAGWSGHGPNRYNTITKVLDMKGKMTYYELEKIRYYGCVGSGFYRIVKEMSNGKLKTTSFYSDSTRTKTGKYKIKN